MTRTQWLIVGLGTLGIAYLFYNRTQVGQVSDSVGNTIGDAVSNVTDTIKAAVAGWKNVGSGPQWVPVLNQIEAKYNLPPDILAATAYQESGFKEKNIRGLQLSSDGLSLGIMQLQTRYFPDLVGPSVPVPYTDQNVIDQIEKAAQIFESNYNALGNWPATIAAFNQGLTGVQRNGITSTKYVANIVGNAPSAVA